MDLRPAVLLYGSVNCHLSEATWLNINGNNRIQGDIFLNPAFLPFNGNIAAHVEIMH